MNVFKEQQAKAWARRCHPNPGRRMFHAFVDQSIGLIFIFEKTVSVVLLQLHSFGIDEDAVPVLLELRIDVFLLNLLTFILGDARTFWLELQDDGKVDFMFDKTQDVLQSLKKKIKDGSATNKEYVQAMILINEATLSNSSTKVYYESVTKINSQMKNVGVIWRSLNADPIPVTQAEQEHRSNAFPSTSCENFPEDCTILKKCACLQLTAKNAKACPLSPDGVYTGYNYKRLQRLIPTGIYECNLLCKCSRQLCQNRVVQHGPQVRLQVFKSEKKGWGVRCLDDIDRGTFVCIFSGRLLSRATPEKTNTDKNRREQQNNVENEFSKKRKIEVACSDCETQPSSPKTEQCSLKFSSDLRESGFVSSESTAPEDENGLKPAPEDLSSKAGAHEDLSSNQVGYSEDGQLMESDVIDITRSREDTSPEGRWKHIATLNDKKTEKVLEVPVKSREEESAASHSQLGFCDEELPNEGMKTLSPSLMRLSKEDVFLLDASKEGNVGRFLNVSIRHSCSPNLCVQNVFVETHDRNFPLVAFFTNRYVKARTELTWDYGYEAGTVPEKEILCQCGVNKCRKKII
ncbi:hypothetical protein U0070_010832 [Myodes glareolus]|uniref:Histone-lysine N-methyltransferase SETDB2 n=1 Tax=Myodes glareolus TaxID=447135 RepID=A0AAW0I349_MYOGA